MFIFTLEPFIADDSSEEQIGTTFELARDREITDIITSVRVDKPSDILKFVYDSVLLPDITYYIRAKRHFASSNLDHYTPTKIIRYDKSKHEALIYNRDNIIETPWVELNEREFHDPNSKFFTLTSSTFKANMSGHEYTSWIIEDSAEQVVLISLEDRENKTYIRVEKNSTIMSRTSLTVHCIHGSSVGIESDVATITIDLQKFNFEVTSPTTDVPVGQVYHLSLRRINALANMNVKRIDVVNPNDNTLLYTIANDREAETLTFPLPWHLFPFDTVVKINVIAINTEGDVGHNSIFLHTATIGIREIEDVEYEYKGEIEALARSTDGVYSDAITTMQIPTGYIPMPIVGSKLLFKYQYVNKRLVKTNESLKGVNLLSVTNSRTYIRYTENNILVVDTWRDGQGADKDPVFLFYRHNTHTDTYDLISMVNHPTGDRYTVSENGSLAQITPTKFLYLPTALGKLYEIDITTSTCVEKANVPSAANNDATYRWFLRLANSRLIIQTGEENFTYRYEIMKDKFETSISVNPISFLKAKPVGRNLPNGDNLIYKTKKISDDDDSAILSYSYKQRRFTQIPTTFAADEYPNGNILLLDNTLLLTKRKTNNDGTSVYITYLYK